MEALSFVLTFLLAWASSIFLTDVSQMDHWVKTTRRRGRYDLIPFRKSQRELIEKKIKFLKPKITAMQSAQPHPVFSLGKHFNEGDAPKMALRYVLQTTALERTWKSEVQEQEMEMDVDVPEVDLRLVDWNEPFLSGVLRKPDDNVAMQDGATSAVQTYITASAAIDLVKLDADKMPDDLFKMGI